MRRSVKRFRLGVAFPKSRSGALKRPIGVRGEGQPAAARPFFFSTATSQRSPSPNRHITSDLTESTTYLLSTPEKLDFVPYNGGRRGIVRLAQRVFSGNPLKSAQIRQESLFPDEAVTGVRTNRTRSARGFKMAENADGVTPFQGRAIGAPPERAPSPPPTKGKARVGKYAEIGDCPQAVYHLLYFLTVGEQGSCGWASPPFFRAFRMARYTIHLPGCQS